MQIAITYQISPSHHKRKKTPISSKVPLYKAKPPIKPSWFIHQLEQQQSVQYRTPLGIRVVITNLPLLYYICWAKTIFPFDTQRWKSHAGYGPTMYTPSVVACHARMTTTYGRSVAFFPIGCLFWLSSLFLSCFRRISLELCRSAMTVFVWFIVFNWFGKGFKWKKIIFLFLKLEINLSQFLTNFRQLTIILQGRLIALHLPSMVISLVGLTSWFGTDRAGFSLRFFVVPTHRRPAAGCGRTLFRSRQLDLKASIKSEKSSILTYFSAPDVDAMFTVSSFTQQKIRW